MAIEKAKWKTTTERFVVFLDIMGFKDLVARNSHREVFSVMRELSKTKKFLDWVFTVAGQKGSVETTTFSDSIMLFSNDNTPNSLKNISLATNYLMREALAKSIPLKGAIAVGEISVDRINQIYFGQPLIDAYLLQEEVYYYGIVAHNSIDKYFNEALKAKKVEDFIEIKTPLKVGLVSHQNLNWFSYIADDDPTIKKEFDDQILKIKSLTSGHPRKYIDNTIEVFNSIYTKK